MQAAAWRRALARYRLACVPGKDDDLKTHLGSRSRYETIDSCLAVLSPPCVQRSISRRAIEIFILAIVSHPPRFLLEREMKFHARATPFFDRLLLLFSLSLSPSAIEERNGLELTIARIYYISLLRDSTTGERSGATARVRGT